MLRRGACLFRNAKQIQSADWQRPLPETAASAAAAVSLSGLQLESIVAKRGQDDVVVGPDSRRA